jgi:hypothetical protein
MLHQHFSRVAGIWAYFESLSKLGGFIFLQTKIGCRDSSMSPRCIPKIRENNSISKYVTCIPASKISAWLNFAEGINPHLEGRNFLLRWNLGPIFRAMPRYRSPLRSPERRGGGGHGARMPMANNLLFEKSKRYCILEPCKCNSRRGWVGQL